MARQVAGRVEADERYHTAGHTGEAQHGGQKPLGRRARGRRKKRELGRGHYDKDRPAMIAWGSRQGAVVIQATRDFTVKTVQKTANIAVQAGSRLYTDSASSYRALKGYVHAYVNHTQKEYARGDVHENRAECLFSLLNPYLRVFRGISKMNLTGYVGFFQFLRNFRQRNALEQAEFILQAALDPVIVCRARQGEFVTCLDTWTSYKQRSIERPSLHHCPRLGIARCGKIHAAHSGSDRCTGIGVMADWSAVVLRMEGPHVRHVDANRRIQ
jgi:transposase-like protein